MKNDYFFKQRTMCTSVPVKRKWVFVVHYGSGANLYTGCFPPIRSRVGTRPPNCDHWFSALDPHHTGQDEHHTDTGHERGVRGSVGPVEACPLGGQEQGAP